MKVSDREWNVKGKNVGCVKLISNLSKTNAIKQNCSERNKAQTSKTV